MARVVCRIEKKYATSKAILAIGKRAHKIKIRLERDINGGCDRNNFWDEVVKTLIPQILNINVVEWEGHKLESLKKL